MKRIKEFLNLWRKPSELPEKEPNNPVFSYDLVLTDGKEKYIGYFNYVGQIFIAYDKVLMLPVKGWKYAIRPKNG